MIALVIGMVLGVLAVGRVGAEGRTPAGPAGAAASGGPITSIDVGGASTCALRGGEVWCWGSNVAGKLGDGTDLNSPTPVRVQTAGTVLDGETIVEVDVGGTVACARTASGVLACWGGDASTSVGDGTQHSASPVAVAGALAGKAVTAVAAGGSHVCALAADGTLACWGSNTKGELGVGSIGTRTTPTAVVTAGGPLAGRTLVDVTVGSRSSCAVASDGTFACWGDNASGQLATGTTSGATTPVAPVLAGTALAGAQVLEVGLGSAHGCARTSTGAVACWGAGTRGELGAGTATSSLAPVSVAVAGGPLAGDVPTDLAVGSASTCARLTSGSVACWGRNDLGRLGTGDRVDRTSPTAVSLARTPLAGRTITLLAGIGTFCATDGTALGCWGDNGFGTLGAGTAGYAPVPGPALAGSLAGQTIAEIDGGAGDGCARTSAGVVHCWGSYHPDRPLAPTVLAVAGTPLASSPAVQVALANGSACATSASGALTCWGNNAELQLGRTGTSRAAAGVATAGSALAGKQVVEVGMGIGFACARTADHVLACWGSNAGGSFGIGTTVGLTETPVAVPVSGTPLEGRTVTDLQVGDSEVCALAGDGKITCWGSTPFLPVVLVPTALAVAGTPLAGSVLARLGGGGFTSCAITTPGAYACWGIGTAGVFGDDQSTISATPVGPTVAGTPLQGRTVTQVVADGFHLCALMTDSTVACQGSNIYGSVGSGWSSTTFAIPTAVAVAGTPLAGATIASISTDGDSTCALTTGSVVSCWGGSGPGTVADATKAVGVTGWSSPVSGATVADAPTGVAAVAGSGQVSLSWTAPGDHGGSAVTGYVVTPFVGGVAQASIALTGAGTSKVVAGLAGGTAYTFKVAAVNGAGTGPRSGASATVTPWGTPSPFGSWAALVDRLCVDLTAVPPSSSARASWVATLSTGGTHPGDLVAALRATEDNTSKVDTTVRLYRALLGRAPDAGGLRFWVTRRRSGSWTLNRMATAFSASPEFTRKYGSLSNRAFVTQIYTDVLGRPADPSGVAYWTGKLDSGARTRGTVMVGFSESSEYKRKQRSNTDVAVAYIYLLGRVPSVAETSAWVSRQDAGTSGAQLARELLDSAAYRLHIQGS